MKVLPIKLPDKLYYELKQVAEWQNTSMAQVIRDQLAPAVVAVHHQHSKQNAQKLTEKAKFYTFNGPIAQSDASDDKVAYGADR